MASMPPYAANLQQRGVTSALNRFAPPQGNLMAPGFSGLSSIAQYLRDLLSQRQGAVGPTTPTSAPVTPPAVAGAPGAFGGRVSPEMAERVGVSTKTSPEAPIKFSWGAGEPQAYTPGISDVLRMSGAPPTREGFMGQAPVAGGSMAGGYGASQPWANVANPGGFPSFWEDLQTQQAMREAQDPLWRERETAGIEAGGQVAAARGIGEAQLELGRRQREMVREDIQRQVEGKISQYQQMFGRPPSPEEIQRIVDDAQAEYSMGSPFAKS